MKRTCDRVEEYFYFPIELWTLIFSYLDSFQKISFSTVCRGWNALVKLSVDNLFIGPHKPNAMPYFSLPTYPNLVELRLQGLVQPTVIARLTGLKSLKLTRTSDCSWPENTEWAVKRLTNLTRLEIAGLGDRDGKGLLSNKLIASFKNLTYLGIVGAPNLRGSAIRNLTNLTWLKIESNRFSNSSLSNLTRLNTLSLYNNASITLKSLTRLTNLTRLRLSRCLVADEPLQQLINLTALDIDDVKDRDLAAILRFPAFNELTVGGGLSDYVLSLATHLTHLDIGRSYCSAAGVSTLTQLTSFVPSLVIGPSSAFQFSHMTNLVHLDISWCGLQKSDSFEHFINLRSFVGHPKMTDEQLVSLTTNLTSLDIRHCRDVHAWSVNRFVHLVRLVPNKNLNWSNIEALKKLSYDRDIFADDSVKTHFSDLYISSSHSSSESSTDSSSSSESTSESSSESTSESSSESTSDGDTSGS